ncbi:four helix bundle protein [Rhodohalobacter sp. SW132]|uniref:four helix bundle protein n=1 Tax=Rhodohalobacter sp. SW132 TaxID=2293433 RepID=UPI000E22043B|nr:four helix bundle protein [Rhodohalobacter sp. SW132]REL24742.1 four helix bundle protein [Rhodohalobacter sp. SW132]
MNDYQGPVYEKSFEFALVIIELYKKLVDQKEYVLSKQLLRSGTSVGANVVEASAAYSKADFAYRMSVASREAREANWWLLLLKKSQLVSVELNNEIESCGELIKLLTSIVKTSQASLKK